MYEWMNSAERGELIEAFNRLKSAVAFSGIDGFLIPPQMKAYTHIFYDLSCLKTASEKVEYASAILSSILTDANYRMMKMHCGEFLGRKYDGKFPTYLEDKLKREIEDSQWMLDSLEIQVSPYKGCKNALLYEEIDALVKQGKTNEDAINAVARKSGTDKENLRRGWYRQSSVSSSRKKVVTRE